MTSFIPMITTGLISGEFSKLLRFEYYAVYLFLLNFT